MARWQWSNEREREMVARELRWLNGVTVKMAGGDDERWRKWGWGDGDGDGDGDLSSKGEEARVVMSSKVAR